jgi:hypothetical protein
VWVSMVLDELTRHLSQCSNLNTPVLRLERISTRISLPWADLFADVEQTQINCEDASSGQITPGGSTFGGDVSDDGFGKPNHKASQLAVFAFQAVQRLFQSRVPINLIGAIGPSLL